MKIQNLAVIFVVIIMPIAIVLASYTKARVQTINMQTDYDVKLDSATYDALKAYQINSYENPTTGEVNSKIRDIKASVNTFFNSMETNFSSLGYTKKTLQTYVPAIVYTMYDGYYIYTPVYNTWDKQARTRDGSTTIDGGIRTEMNEEIGNQYTYHEYDSSSSDDNANKPIYDLKPYVYYSCRYVTGGADVVITYSLDNYIQIEGTMNGKAFAKSGYLLNDINLIAKDGTVYNGGSSEDTTGIDIGDIIRAEYHYNNDSNYATITREGSEGFTSDIRYEVKENAISKKNYDGGDIDASDQNGNYYCIKRGGTKYYFDESAYRIFYLDQTGKKVQEWPQVAGASISNENVSDFTSQRVILQNNNALRYYKEAYEMRYYIENSPLKDLTLGDAMITYNGTTESYRNIYNNKSKLKTLEDNGISFTGSPNDKIFDFDHNTDSTGVGGIESEQSNFNNHRIDVIKNTIQSNLAVVMSTYNKTLGLSGDYKLPKLKESEWDKVINNIGIITFMQGANIGGKVYNGYSIVTNTKNEDVVMDDSIYIKTSNDNTSHRITDKGLPALVQNDTGAMGIFNVNTEPRPVDSTNATNGKYYMPIDTLLSYDSVVTQSNVQNVSDSSVKAYINGLSGAGGEKLKRLFYTALGRERYGIYRASQDFQNN